MVLQVYTTQGEVVSTVKLAIYGVKIYECRLMMWIRP